MGGEISPTAAASAAVVKGAWVQAFSSSGTHPAGMNAGIPSRQTGTSLPKAPLRKASARVSKDRTRCTPFRSTQRHCDSEATMRILADAAQGGAIV